MRAALIMGGTWFFTSFLKALLLDRSNSLVAAFSYGAVIGVFMMVLTLGILALINRKSSS